MLFMDVGLLLIVIRVVIGLNSKNMFIVFGGIIFVIINVVN